MERVVPREQDNKSLNMWCVKAKARARVRRNRATELWRCEALGTCVVRVREAASPRLRFVFLYTVLFAMLRFRAAVGGVGVAGAMETSACIFLLLFVSPRAIIMYPVLVTVSFISLRLRCPVRAHGG